ncbi:MAG: insulinase family protein [Flavobacteriaceae bacterium]|nr:insulinase family protein [Flavobacteriaceae bacterium]
MKKNVWALFLFGAISIYAQNKPEKSIDNQLTNKVIPTDPNTKIGKLENGLTYYVRNNGKPEDKLELRLVINVGSILEDEDQKGLAHFMEHMNFNGTKNFKKNDLVDYLQSIGVEFGADLNAYTGFDQTVYILPIPSDDPEKLEKGFLILQDWAHGALLTAKDIDEERGVVLEEYRTRLGADTRMLSKYLPIVANNSKYASRLPIGTKESIENFSYQSLRRFFKDWYRPDLMAVVAVGDLDAKQIEEKIKKHFGNIPKAKNPRKREVFTIPNHQETYVAIETDKEAAFTQVQIAYKDRGERKVMETQNDYRNSLIKSLFTQMINNRLNELRNSPNPPFVFGYSYHGTTLSKEKMAYQSFANTSESGQLKALEAFLTENERVKRYGFQKSEMERAKKSLIANVEKAYKDRDKMESSRLVQRYINHYLNKTPIPGESWRYKHMQQILPGIDLQEVNALIQKFLHDDNRTIVLTGPEKESVKKVNKQEVLDLLQKVKKAKIDPYDDGSTRSSLMPTLPKKGTITKREHNKELDFFRLTLSNGAQVVYKKTDFKNDEILLEAYSYGGRSLYSTSEIKKIGSANGALFEAGVDGMNKTELQKVLSGKIVNLSPFIGNLSEGFRGSTTPKDLESTMQLMYLYFSKLNKDDKAFTSFIAKQKAFLANIKSNPSFFFSIEFGNYRNEGNPRYMPFPTAESLDASDYDLAYKKAKERFANAGDFNFYFVGNIETSSFENLVETYIASLEGTPNREQFKDHGFRPKTGPDSFMVKKGTEPKSRVQLLYSGLTAYSAKENLHLNLLADILSIKLIEQLREKEGGVYGAGARGSISQYPTGQFSFSIGFPCGPDNVDKLIEASLAEVDKLIQEGPTQKDLDKVKESKLLKHKEALKKNTFWNQSLKNLDYFQRDIGNITSYEDQIQNITASDIHKTAKEFLSKPYIKAILMPED